MDRRTPSHARFSPVLLAVVVVGVLYFAREILIPIALAILLSFLLAPLVRSIQRLGIRTSIAATLAMALALAVVTSLGLVVAGEIMDLAGRLPEYKYELRAKLNDVFSSRSNVLARAIRTIAELKEEVAAPTDDAADQAAPERPVPVELVESSSVGFLRFVLGPVLAPLVTAGIAMVLSIFMLVQREDIRDRFMRLMGRRLSSATQALDDAAERVSRYLLAQSILNGCVGLTIALGLFLLKVPNAALFGFLAGILRFLPYVGLWLAALVPLVLTWATSPGWTAAILVVALFLVVEIVAGNFVEPVLQGTKTGISTTAVLIAALFWTWLWGGLGLLLATPLTVCLAVIGRHVPQFEFLRVVLGDEPVLAPEARLYQRLLAMEPEEAGQIAETFAKDKPAHEVYDSLIVPALRLAEADRHRGLLDQDQVRFIVDAIGDIIDEVAPPAIATDRGPITILSAFDPADELAGRMLGQLLAAAGVEANLIAADVFSGEVIAELESRKPVVVVVSCVPPRAAFHGRARAKRLRAKFPELPLVIGLWVPGADESHPSVQRLHQVDNVRVVDTMAQAVDTVKALASVQPSEKQEGPTWGPSPRCQQ